MRVRQGEGADSRGAQSQVRAQDSLGPEEGRAQEEGALALRGVKKTGDAALAIDVTYEGWSPIATQKKGGLYTHNITLTAPAPFNLLGTMVYTTGDMEGNQAIIIRPARPFPFVKLPKELRARIYDFYFAPKGLLGDAILLDGKRSNKDVYAKTYAEGHQHRVGLLAVNKEISTEATPHLYTLPLRLDSTATLLDFLSQLPTPVRRPPARPQHQNLHQDRLRARPCTSLAESRDLRRFHVGAGVCGDADPAKAARLFYADACKFLQAVGAVRGRKDAGVDILSFGPLAFTAKDAATKEVRPWAAPMVEEFRENLRAKLK
ncbi:hypothetical protein Tdes44962_MAKER03605 [Teratosphaeria destructans]|uniref:Uncharacterized protein n=1 Tax=Teratosphaeria destructans TaxID=418781 RepID=A0A9W7W139_9PEZI|nr:hypothetical protein Tdes44962_MAKER03605 [Teratosphaeria destructans]